MVCPCVSLSYLKLIDTRERSQIILPIAGNNSHLRNTLFRFSVLWQTKVISVLSIVFEHAVALVEHFIYVPNTDLCVIDQFQIILI